MKRALTIFCLLMALIGALLVSSGLSCYKMGLDGWKKAYCWSNEFVVGEVEPTATEIVIIYPTDQPTDEPTETIVPWPTATAAPTLPYPLPTWDPNPYPNP